MIKNALIENQVFSHSCITCGTGDAPFGFGVDMRKGVKGQWYCRAHKAIGEARGGIPADYTPPAAPARQGVLV